jgi:hypothetical protein
MRVILNVGKLNSEPQHIAVGATICEIHYIVSMQIQGGTRRNSPTHRHGAPQRIATLSAEIIISTNFKLVTTLL